MLELTLHLSGGGGDYIVNYKASLYGQKTSLLFN